MVVPVTARQAIADDEFEGWKIPKASLIHFYAFLVNTNTEIWGPDASEFRPERWDNIKDVPNTQFFTFQHGLPPLNPQSQIASPPVPTPSSFPS